MRPIARRLGALLLVSTLLLPAPVAAAWPGSDGGATTPTLLDRLAAWFLPGGDSGAGEEAQAAPGALTGLSTVPTDDATTTSTPTAPPDPVSDDGSGGGEIHPGVDPDG